MGAPYFPAVGYTVGKKRYLNITNRCSLVCEFCPKTKDEWLVHGHYLRLTREPSVEEIIEAAGDVRVYKEHVFCGLGEPTLRLYDVLQAALILRQRGAVITLVTDGLANLVYRRDVTPDLEGIIDRLSVSLNAHNEAVYDRYCHGPFAGAFDALIDFTRRAKDYVPDITMTVVAGLPGVDVQGCVDIAKGVGVHFRVREPGQID
jgi:TatD family-associated radical SAM protein